MKISAYYTTTSITRDEKFIAANFKPNLFTPATCTICILAIHVVYPCYSRKAVLSDFSDTKFLNENLSIILSHALTFLAFE